MLLLICLLTVCKDFSLFKSMTKFSYKSYKQVENEHFAGDPYTDRRLRGKAMDGTCETRASDTGLDVKNNQNAI